MGYEVCSSLDKLCLHHTPPKQKKPSKLVRMFKNIRILFLSNLTDICCRTKEKLEISKMWRFFSIFLHKYVEISFLMT